MTKIWALFFAVIGTLLLACIGAAISYRNIWLVLSSVIVTLLFVGSGFVVKARTGRERRG